MKRILVLGAAGAMAAVAIEDLLERTDHELVLADLSARPLEAWPERAPERVTTRAVDVRDAAGLGSAMADVDVVLNTTWTRFAVPVTRAAIAAGVDLVDLGAYAETTLELLALDEEARAAGCCVVPGCGGGPGLNGLLGRHGADQLDAVDSIEMYSHLNDPIGMSAGIVITRLESSVGMALVLEDGELVERPNFGEGRIVEFAAPIGPIRVHYLPHPEPITLPRFVDVPNVSYMLGYGESEEAIVRGLVDLGFTGLEPIAVGDQAVAPAVFAAALLGGRGIDPGRETVNAKHTIVSGTLDGAEAQLIYDMGVFCTGASASALVTGVCAAVGTDLVAQGGCPRGVVPSEGAFDPPSFVGALAARGIAIQETRIVRSAMG
ncbi:MAG: saccharopine dehydrogenase NADP-binding domain-containing protein [Actinobacteria bacterium]|nr:saccharopine dehydrogenase NADP-binding domain-containing protein [Actinomycetota bacterium]